MNAECCVIEFIASSSYFAIQLTTFSVLKIVFLVHGWYLYSSFAINVEWAVHCTPCVELSYPVTLKQK